MGIGVTLVANPTAGQGRAKKVALAALDEFERRGYAVDLMLTEVAGHGADLARIATETGSRIIVAVGGDGTIAEIVNGMVGTGTTLGVIPAGTANDFAKEMRLPQGMSSAVDVIIKGKTKSIDLGRTNTGKYFLNMAGIGFDATVIENLNLKLKRWLKDAAYIVAAVQTLILYTPPLLNIQVDGDSYEGSFAVIGNSRYYGGILSVTTEARNDDGYLDVCIFKGLKKSSLYKYLIGAVTRTHTRFPDVACVKAKDIKITSNTRVSIQADGDIIGELPMEFTVVPNALKVIVP